MDYVTVPQDGVQESQVGPMWSPWPYMSLAKILGSISSSCSEVVRNIPDQWMTFLIPEMEIRNLKWVQCGVTDHICHWEKDWGPFLLPALR